ncbi:MAG: hypothetical protein GY702_27370 [Desulfobulbaceae bacterium]|nr:hypothetical protein [Desulfobulbaceae bacterium]
MGILAADIERRLQTLLEVSARYYASIISTFRTMTTKTKNRAIALHTNNNTPQPEIGFFQYPLTYKGIA